MNTKKGFTLITAIVVTSILLLVSFVVADIAVKELVIAYSRQESQYSFYNADSGIECAEYWDAHGPGGSSAFGSTTDSISCNNENISSSQLVQTVPSQYAVIGGGTYPNIFEVDYSHGCAIVQVVKSGASTTISSRGYNTCDTTSDRRYERGIQVQY